MAGRRLKSVEKIFELLTHLAEEGPSTPTVLAERMGLPTSTVYDYLATLEDIGYAVKSDGEYSISARMLYFGSKMREDSKFYEMGKPVAKSLSRELGEQAVLTVVEGPEVIYIYTHSNNDQFSLSLHPGVTVPLHVCASGRAILAHLPEEAREAFIEEWIVDDPDETTTKAELERELSTIHEQGYAITRYQRGTESIAAPVRREGELVGTISVGGPANRMSDESFRTRVIDDVLDAANLIEINMMQYVEP